MKAASEREGVECRAPATSPTRAPADPDRMMPSSDKNSAHSNNVADQIENLNQGQGRTEKNFEENSVLYLSEKHFAP